jgi:hypothetical protein
MRFLRASQNPERVSASWAEAFAAGGARRRELFARFCAANEDIEAVELEMQRERAYAANLHAEL